MSFVHLHVHTHYSLLDSTIRIPALMERCQEFEMPAVALTDHGNLFGAVEMFKAARKGGIKPIIGCEVSVPSLDPETREDRRFYSMVLLAATNEGYQNLIELVSDAWIQRNASTGGTPVVRPEVLEANRNGIIALSGGLSGELSQTLLRKDPQRAERVASTCRDLFGSRYYIEVQPAVLHEHQVVQEPLLHLAQRMDIPAVAANDCHYLERADAAAHRALMCIQLNKSLRDAERLPVDGFHVWAPDDMRKAFSEWPEVCENTLRIAHECDVELDLGNSHLPTYEVPDGYENSSVFLRSLAGERLENRVDRLVEMGLDCDGDRYKARLSTELNVIEEMGYAGYFLIVWDFISWAKENGVPVGPGRGSGAGSLVAYALGITDINPIQYDLLFERFLNSARVSMPDFDIDFCMNERDRVIRYVTEKYGEMNVGQIVTFGSLKARGVIRDVARVMELSYGDADRVAKLVPDVLNISLAEALEQEPRLKQMVEEDQTIAKLLETAMSLENLYRHSGVHAAGIVIAEKPLWNYVPILTGDHGELITQFAKKEVEEAGLVKFDFLGLKTLTVIDRAVRLIRDAQPEGEALFDIATLPMDDSAVFKLLQSGNTTGVFQLESRGFKDLIKRLKPDKFEDIIAAVALYRPGPLQSGMVDSFIRRKHGEEAINTLHPSLKDVLAETYGTIIYQEQVMRLASILAGFTLQQADLLRRAMGKKEASVMAEQRQAFIDGAVANEIDDVRAAHIFDLVQEFASYGFNKSHSAAYGLISYQTAFLKAHHPVAFMAALLTCDKDNTDKVVRYIHEARAMGIEIMPPDVNRSDLDFSISQGAIRFGLGAIKNCGEGAIEGVLEARREGGAFTSLFDFCERVDSRRVNRRVLEGLVQSGAFDLTGRARDVLFANIDRAMERGQAVQHDLAVGQISLFNELAAATEESGPEDVYEAIAPEDEWPERMQLSLERESVGFYITGHPIDRYQREIGRYTSATSATLDTQTTPGEISLGVVVAGIRERTLRDGSGRMATLQLEDQLGQIEAVCFSKSYMEYETLLKSDEPLIVEGSVRMEGEGETASLRLRIDKVATIAQARRASTERVLIGLAALQIDETLIAQLKEVFRQHPGVCKTSLSVRVANSALSTVHCGEQWTVDPSDELIGKLERIAGRECITFR